MSIKPFDKRKKPRGKEDLILSSQSVVIALVSSIIVLILNVITFFGVFVKIVRWVDRQKQQDVELNSIRHEQSILIVGVLVCLKNLPETRNNEEVKETIKLFEKHLNDEAHKPTG